MTENKINELRQRCTWSLAGHFQHTPAEGFAAMADWCLSNNVAHDTYGDGELIQGFERKISELLGKEKALFCVTGTMSQVTALRLACNSRQQRLVALHPSSHILKHERSNFQLLNHFHALQLGDPFRPWSVEDLRTMAEPIAAALYELPMRKIGGQLPSWDELEAIKSYCREKNIHLHMDGARLWEATSGFGKDLREIAMGFDSVYVSFYKGIGGLGGAMLLGSENFIDQAKIWIQRQGGNVYRRTPYVVSAAMKFEERLAAMPAYYQRTLWLYDVLELFPSLRANPAKPQSNMLHLYLPVDAARATSIRNAIAERHRVWLFDRVVNAALPAQCMFEWYIGDQLLMMPDDKVRQALHLLSDAVSLP